MRFNEILNEQHSKQYKNIITTIKKIYPKLEARDRIEYKTMDEDVRLLAAQITQVVSMMGNDEYKDSLERFKYGLLGSLNREQGDSIPQYDNVEARWDGGAKLLSNKSLMEILKILYQELNNKDNTLSEPATSPEDAKDKIQRLASLIHSLATSPDIKNYTKKIYQHTKAI